VNFEKYKSISILYSSKTLIIRAPIVIGTGSRPSGPTKNKAGMKRDLIVAFLIQNNFSHWLY
jgi:hypothetical protein